MLLLHVAKESLKKDNHFIIDIRQYGFYPQLHLCLHAQRGHRRRGLHHPAAVGRQVDQGNHVVHV